MLPFRAIDQDASPEEILLRLAQSWEADLMVDPSGLAAGASVNTKEIHLDHSELVLPANLALPLGKARRICH